MLDVLNGTACLGGDDEGQRGELSKDALIRATELREMKKFNRRLLM
jgi:hypothetical protein